jgi:hypothetical protein
VNLNFFVNAYAMNMATHFKYCFFVTLTYKDIFLPYLSVEVVRRSGNRYLFDENFETMVPTSDPRLLTPEYYHDRDFSLDPSESQQNQTISKEDHTALRKSQKTHEYEYKQPSVQDESE